jgi:predicted aldo/keto reductase-like oxidoreductase
MSHDQNELKRRTFLKSGLLAAAGASTLGQSALRAQSTDTPSEKTATSPHGIPMRPFGKTGHTLPVLGFGGSAMVRMFAGAYGIDLLSMEERAAMVRYGYDKGIRYFDTARVYGESEEIMGAGLKGVRENCYIATKCHDPRPENVRQRVETSLEKLGVDWVDCVQIHSPAIERVGFEGAMKLHAELVKLKDEGLLKFIGLTTHIAFETVHQMICTGGFDQVLLAYGYFKKGMDTMLSNKKLENRELCLAKAHDLGMGIVAMKVLGANIISHNSPKVLPDYDEEKRTKLPAAAIRWTLDDERVSMLNIGVSYPSDVDKNLATLTGDVAYTNEDSQLLADFCTRAYESEFVKQMRVT